MGSPRIAAASREGTSGPLADAVFTHATHSHTAAALVDGMGHSADIVRIAPMLAETAAVVAASRGPLAGILAAGLLVADPDRPDAVAVVATTWPNGRYLVCWAGDSAAWSWDGEHLTRITSEPTLAAYLSRVAGAEVSVSALADVVGVSLGNATPASARVVSAPAGLLLLTSDGAHDQLPAGVLERLVREHADDPQALADAIVAGAQPDAAGYRDDATALVITTTPEESA